MNKIKEKEKMKKKNYHSFTHKTMQYFLFNSLIDKKEKK